VVSSRVQQGTIKQFFFFFFFFSKTVDIFILKLHRGIPQLECFAYSQGNASEAGPIHIT
jgi:hypothetical protein